MKPESRAFLARVVVPTAFIALGIVVGYSLAHPPGGSPAAFVGMRMRQPPPTGTWLDLLNLFGAGSLTWVACAISVPLFVWLARRFPVSRQGWPMGLISHAVAVVVLVSGTSLAYYTLLLTGAGRPPFAPFLRMRLVSQALPFVAMIAAIHALEFHRRYREREALTARLSAQLAQSRLDALSAQLHPHFLFNTLQAISTLMHRDVKTADAVLSQLSDLLRRTLGRGDHRREVPLEEELDLLRLYVGISGERFGSRLVFESEIAPDVRQALVPFFVLQPLVENALEHGIARRAGAGRVAVRAERHGEMLELSVTDDGAGLPDGWVAGEREGIGLSNTRSRLRHLYQDRQAMVIESPPTGGLCVRLSIPLRTASPETA